MVTAKGVPATIAGNAGYAVRSGRYDARGLQKYDVQSVPCFFLKIEGNHLSSAAKLLKALTSGVCYTIDVVLTVPCTRTLPAPARGEGVNGRLVSADTPKFTISYMRPPPPAQQLPSTPLAQPPSSPLLLQLSRPPRPPASVSVSGRTRSKTVRFSTVTEQLPPPPSLVSLTPPPPMRVSDQTKPKTVQLSTTPEEPTPSIPEAFYHRVGLCLLYTSPSPRD